MSVKTYQWIKGDKAGEVVKSDGTLLQEDETNFVVFLDGSRCNEDLFGDYIMEIASDHSDDLILMNEMSPTPLTRVEPVIEKPKAKVVKEITKSPLEALLSTSKKFTRSVGVCIQIEVPPNDLIKVLSSSFDDGKDQVITYLKNSITDEMVEKIKTQIAIELTSNIFEDDIITTETIEDTQENLENYERV